MILFLAGRCPRCATRSRARTLGASCEGPLRGPTSGEYMGITEKKMKTTIVHIYIYIYGV